MKQFVLRG